MNEPVNPPPPPPDVPSPGIPAAEGQASSPGMPRWIPILIGVVLVGIAGLAVFTGLRYRGNTLTSQLPSRSARPATNAPPGEPDAGASLVMHGREGEDTTPDANEPVQGQSRAVITGGGAQGVQTVVRIWARRGMVLDVLPEDAMVYVNDILIGEVRQFNSTDEIYDFAEPGSYTVRILAPSGAQKTYIITAGDDAKQDIARISAKL